jgi:hypothetical protein
MMFKTESKLNHLHRSGMRSFEQSGAMATLAMYHMMGYAIESERIEEYTRSHDGFFDLGSISIFSYLPKHLDFLLPYALGCTST